jgi:hypothetical protein
MLALHVPGPEFDPQHCQRKKEKKELLSCQE